MGYCRLKTVLYTRFNLFFSFFIHSKIHSSIIIFPFKPCTIFYSVIVDKKLYVSISYSLRFTTCLKSQGIFHEKAGNILREKAGNVKKERFTYTQKPVSLYTI